MKVNNNINVGRDVGDIETNVNSKNTGNGFSVVNRRTVYKWIGTIVSLMVIAGFLKFYVATKYAFKMEELKARNLSEIKDKSKDELLEGESAAYFGKACDFNQCSGTHFETEEVLKFLMRIVRVSFDDEYKFISRTEKIIEVINDGMSLAGIEMVCSVEEFASIPEMKDKTINYLALLDLYHRTDIFTLVIVPEGVVFYQEVKGNVRTGRIHGAAKSIGDYTMFMRDESAESNITVHEMLHALLALRHTHAGSFPLASDGYTCISDTDRVYSTPQSTPGYFRYNEQTGACGFRSNTDPNMTDIESKIISSNYMSYTNPNCMNKDTVGLLREQIEAGRNYIEDSPGIRALIIKEIIDVDPMEMLFKDY